MYDDIAEIYSEIFPVNPAFLAFITTYLEHPGATILDLGCATGDCVDALARMHYETTGIDNSSAMIEHARKNKRGTFIECTFEALGTVNGKFHCVYCIGNSLSYIAEDAMQQFLQTIRDKVHPGGYLLLQVVNWDKFKRTGKMVFPVKTLTDGRTFHRAYRIQDACVIFTTELRKHKTVLKSWSAPLYPRYAVHLQQQIGKAGMTVLDSFGAYDKRPFNPESSPALIITAQLPEAAPY